MLPDTLLPLWFHYGAGCRPGLIKRVQARCAGLSEAYEAVRRGGAGAAAYLPEQVAKRLAFAAADGFLERSAETFCKQGIRWTVRGQAGYPALLTEIHDPPGVLFYRGSLPGDERLPLAVVGSRACSDYGRRMAATFAYAFAAAGASVISGMASGVDTAAARGALGAAGNACPTLAVLGTGVDVVYPAENARLYAQITERGAALSEFWPGTKPARENFPIRNRIMSGMSRAVVVIEAGEKSGTSITVGLALEMGRDVFALPARLTDQKSVGSNRMLQMGEARPAFCPEDVLGEYGWAAAAADGTHENAPAVVRFDELPAVQQAIWKTLQAGEKTFDELCDALPYSAGEINSGLTAMLFSEIMKQLPGRVYALDPLGAKVAGVPAG